jgi:hypothetical protein
VHRHGRTAARERVALRNYEEPYYKLNSTDNVDLAMANIVNLDKTGSTCSLKGHPDVHNGESERQPKHTRG